MTPRRLLYLALPALAFGTACAPGAEHARSAGPGPEVAAAQSPLPPPREADPAGLLALPDNRDLRAGFVVVDGVYNTELMAPWDVFEHVRYQTDGGPAIEVFTVSPDGGPITTAEGLRILADYGFENAPAIDILVVPSAEGSRDRDLENASLIDFVRERGEGARFVMSLCWGAFVLARAGLLDGRACTTFPRDYRRFAETFPAADLHVNVSFVHQGRMLTSEGGARSYLVAIYLIDLLFGERVAAGVGSGLLIPWPPDPASRPPIITDPALQRLRRPS